MALIYIVFALVSFVVYYWAAIKLLEFVDWLAFKVLRIPRGKGPFRNLYY